MPIHTLIGEGEESFPSLAIDYPIDLRNSKVHDVLASESARLFGVLTALAVAFVWTDGL